MNLENTTHSEAQQTARRESVDALAYGTAPCALGELMVARSSNGVRAVLIGDSVDELKTDLASRFPSSTLRADAAAVHDDLARLVLFMEDPAQGLELTLDMRGTPFQQRVWDELRAIPLGRTVSYGELARSVGPLASPRAVASACAANPIAVAVPCHRVVRSDGELAGYRWGTERKRELIRRERRA